VRIGQTYYYRNGVEQVEIVDRFEIPFYQYLNEHSEIAADAPALATDCQALLKLYRLMVLVRMIDAKAIALQRTGKLGTYPSTRGQEAVFVGMGNALEPKDIFVPYYRDMGAMIQHSVTLSEILLYWGGDERGNGVAPDNQNFPYCVPIGSQALHAAGAAFAVKFHQQKRAVLASCGDGATSQGDFYEAMNVAGVWKLPVVFAVCNNQWAISVPRQAQTHAKTLAQKAIAAGIPGEQVDGNDVIAVRYRISEALRLAREEHQPRLVEMICYRQCDHTTADDASRYEPQLRREQEWKKEPIKRLHDYLEKMGQWSAQQEAALIKECELEMDEAVKAYLAYPAPPRESMFDYLYAELPKAYAEQREILKNMETIGHG
jgi:2-oxoisovalerate dehydrogenase E1 component alpha subunit